MKFAYAEEGFLRCVQDAVNLVNASEGLTQTGKSTALRGSLLLIVSAFDFLVHEIVRIEILERARKDAGSLKISIPFALSVGEGDSLLINLDQHVRRKNSYKAFVSPAKIKECFSDVSIDIWVSLEEICDRDAKDDRKKLDEIWKWRNRLAHEGDLVPSNLTFVYWPVYSEDVVDAADFLSALSRDILKLMRSRSP